MLCAANWAGHADAVLAAHVVKEVHYAGVTYRMSAIFEDSRLAQLVVEVNVANGAIYANQFVRFH